MRDEGPPARGAGVARRLHSWSSGDRRWPRPPARGSARGGRQGCGLATWMKAARERADQLDVLTACYPAERGWPGSPHV